MMSGQGSVLGRRIFTEVDQNRFAKLSGDFNPLHIDALHARRTAFGEPVVHGIHNMVWALELCFQHLSADTTGRGGNLIPGGVSAKFLNPVRVGDLVEARVTNKTSRQVSVSVSHRDQTVLELDVEFGDTPVASEEPAETATEFTDTPKDRSFDEIDGLSGRTEVIAQKRQLQSEFPCCVEEMGASIVAHLLGLSRLVGMECPGLHSVFSSVSARLGPVRSTGHINYSVVRAHKALSLVRMEFEGGGISGTLDTFYRSPPVHQLTFDEVAERVRPNQFSGRKALIVGGSRGLGEVTAKIIAAGGGTPIITYRVGKEEADALVAELRSRGGNGDCLQFDVEDPATAFAELEARNWRPNEIFYFATPAIFARRTNRFDEDLLAKFTSIYVDGFYRTYEGCRALTDDPIRMFYPSSVALDNPVKDMLEYSSAKAAGEMMCRYINSLDTKTTVICERLPRVDTDQTTSFLKVASEPALDAMLKIIQKFENRLES
jgi:acyl dehydratase/NAD(P)-dependent dehydrogenase (short-subunit alcohol dehydrogenase family)